MSAVGEKIIGGSTYRVAESASRKDVVLADSHGGVPKVSVVIPVLNDASGLARCLASIRANDYPDARLEIIVADNGSTDGSPEVAARAGATVVALPGVSVAAVRNRIAAIATGEVLAFVDADHELSAGWLRSAIDALAQPHVAAVGAPYHPPAHATWVQRMYDSFRSRTAEPSETRWLGGGNLAIWSWAFADAGGFDTRLTACEDVDLCQRVRQRGLRLVADERLYSVHHGDPRTLRQLFVSELWRGRDNLLVSFRGPLRIRDLPSVLLPLVMLASLLALPVAGLAAAFGMPLLLVIVLGVVMAVPAARALAMVRRLNEYTPIRLAQAFVVAATYDVARALALVIRKSHRRAR
jgi:GT2 family glycosyltransferase